MSLSTMQEANRLQKALKRGGPTFGAWQVSYTEEAGLFMTDYVQDATWVEYLKKHCADGSGLGSG